MRAYSLTSITTLLLTAVAAMTFAADVRAGAHQGGGQAPNAIQLDPAKRSDIKGTVLVTGANRGIGLELARNYAERGWKVIATARNPGDATELNALAKSNPRVTVAQMDLLDFASIEALATKLKGVPIDVLLNNAATLGDPAKQDFGKFDYALMQEVFAINTVGTMKMTETFFDNVLASEQKKIVAITSLQASISQLRDPFVSFYKMSKAALNMGMRSLSRQLKSKKITIALISPGAVDTEMMKSALDHAKFKPKGNFLITPEQSAEAVINIINQYDLKMTGTFMSHEGDEIPW